MPRTSYRLWALLTLSALATPKTSYRLWVPLLQVPQLLDVVVSPVVPVASLSSSGRVIIFPE